MWRLLHTSGLAIMSSTLIKIVEIKAEMAWTQRNKATAHHLEPLKAHPAKLHRELITPKGSGGPEEGFGMSRAGDA